MTVLVIDDSRFAQLAIDKILHEAGYRTLLAADGETGLRTAIQTPPDIILLDVMLPGLPGTSVLRSLKHNPLTAGIPVIVLTGLQRLDAVRLQSEGADGFLSKPDLDLEGGGRPLIDMIRKTLAAGSHLQSVK